MIVTGSPISTEYPLDPDACLYVMSVWRDDLDDPPLFVIYSTPEDIRKHIADCCRSSDWQCEIEMAFDIIGGIDLKPADVVNVRQITKVQEIPNNYQHSIPWGQRELNDLDVTALFYAIQAMQAEQAREAEQRRRESENAKRQVSLLDAAGGRQ